MPPNPLSIVARINIPNGLPVGKHEAGNFPLHVASPTPMVPPGIYGLVPLPGSDAGVGTDSVTVDKGE